MESLMPMMVPTRRLALQALGAAATLPAFAQSCTPKVAADQLVTPGKLQMSINPTLPPQQFVDEKGEQIGRAHV